MLGFAQGQEDAMSRWWTLIWIFFCCAASTAELSDYPVRPVRVIIPVGPGANTDLLGRIVFTQMAERFGKQLVVDNRSGAGGTIGMEIASHARPDGYTVVGVAASMLAITPHIYRKLAYDPLRDFVPVGTFVLAQTALCVNNKVPARTVQEFVAFVKARPKEVLMSSAGIGATSHLGGVLFATLAGIPVNHVPYKGGMSLVGVSLGEAHWTMAPLSAAVPHIKAGRIRCLATGGDKRSAVVNLPTVAESGVPGFRLEWRHRSAWSSDADHREVQPRDERSARHR
jgi:tripartite-type tricarboxylate transporter receptor subunit TctC